VKTTAGGVTQTLSSYDYDLMGRVIKHGQTVEGRTYTMGYGYNYVGQMVSQTYPSGRAVSYSYNEAAQLSGVSDLNRTYASVLSYAPHGGLRSEKLGNGVAHAYSYNDRLQLTQVKLSVSKIERQRYDYVYGQADLNTGAVDATKNTGQVARVEGFVDGVKQWQQRYSYDSLGRLSTAREMRGDNSQQAWRADYTYDRYGNRFQAAGQSFGLPVAEADISPQTNRFTAGVTYDGAGNVTADGKFRSMQYQYDANGRVRWSAVLDGSSPSSTVYDGLGQRVAATQAGVTRHFVYDIFGMVVAEYQATGAWERDYVYRAGLMLASVEASGALRYTTADHQASARVVTNESGAVVARHDYLPYGEELGAGAGMRSGAQGYGAADVLRQRYALTERDETTGLEHTKWRKLETRAGRWNSPDPYRGSMAVGNPQSFNRYSYVENDPLNFVDPSGLRKICFGYHVTFVSIERATRRVVSSRYGGFVPVMCFDIGGEGKDLTARLRGKFTPKQLERFKAALADMLARLSKNNGKNKCADAFGGLDKAMEALSKTNFEFESLGGPRDIGGNGFPSMYFYNKLDAYADGSKVGINSDGRFMMEGGRLPIANRPGESILANEALFSLGDVEAASFILLHELGHRRKIFGADDRDADQKGDDEAETDRNNKKIYDACFSE
jgi:RHS repeat-associated protein